MSAVVEFDLSLECFSVHIITGWVESSFLRHTRGDMHGQYFSLPVSMMGWIQIKMGHPLTQNGAALAPFRANGAHPSK